METRCDRLKDWSPIADFINHPTGNGFTISAIYEGIGDVVPGNCGPLYAAYRLKVIYVIKNGA
jgi:hypothetical protein